MQWDLNRLEKWADRKLMEGTLTLEEVSPLTTHRLRQTSYKATSPKRTWMSLLTS